MHQLCALFKKCWTFNLPIGNEKKKFLEGHNVQSINYDLDYITNSAGRGNFLVCFLPISVTTGLVD